LAGVSVTISSKVQLIWPRLRSWWLGSGASSPSSTRRQEAHLVALLKSGEYSTAEIGDLFGVARSTVYRAIGRHNARQRAQRSGAAPMR
jgi:DNA-binding CsgD family transcriptional regulator